VKYIGRRSLHATTRIRSNQETGNLKLAQKILGHSSFSTTADVDVHTSSEADREAALARERAIFGNLFVNVPNFEKSIARKALELRLD